uniref:hypothetical protein n=1 Tax=Clostridium sp. TaxID=1506 RepID=UPI0026100331
MNFIDTEHDFDSCKDIWDKLYYIIYKKSFDSIFDFETIEDKETSPKCKRWYIKIDKKKNPKLRNEYPAFKIAGDCIFNFNEKKLKLFKELLDVEDYPLLEYCSSNHHELCNFSFMPITGGMNNKKGILHCNSEENYAYDRFDLFIYELNQYYNEKPSRIFSKYNKEALIWFLKLFNNVYEYCQKIYMIDDKEFVDAIILSGSSTIINRERAIEYMKLAKRYW